MSNCQPDLDKGRRNESQWLTKQQAAEYLSCSPRLIERLVSERRLTFTKIAKFIRIKRSDLDAFAEAGRVAAQR